MHTLSARTHAGIHNQNTRSLRSWFPWDNMGNQGSSCARERGWVDGWVGECMPSLRTHTSVHNQASAPSFIAFLVPTWESGLKKGWVGGWQFDACLSFAEGTVGLYLDWEVYS